MSTGSIIKVEGFDQLVKNFAKLEKKMKGKTLRQSMMFASKPMLASVKGGIAVDSSVLKKSIKRSSKLYRQGSVIQLRLGIKSDKSLGNRNPAIYGPMHEAGSVASRSVGFMRKGFDGNHGNAVSRFKSKLAENILKNLSG